MRKNRTRPFWAKHWTRFDGVYRSRGMRWMFCVVDRAELGGYAIVMYDAQAPAEGTIVHTAPYSDNAFAITCQMAEGLAHTASREEHAQIAEAIHAGS